MLLRNVLYFFIIATIVTACDNIKSHNDIDPAGDNNNQTIDYLKSISLYNITIFGESIDLSQMVVNKERDTLSFKDIFMGNNKCIYLYFNDMTCAQCIQEQFKILSDYPSILESDNFKLLVGFNSFRKIYVLLKTLEIQTDFYVINPKILSNIIASQDIPQYIVINDQGIIEYSFVTSKSMPEFTRQFLDRLSVKLKQF